MEAQETDSLWIDFKKKLDRQVAIERERYYFDDSDFAYHLSKSIINTSIEKHAVTFLSETYKADTLQNVRDLITRMMEEIAFRSNDDISRKIAIHYILDTSFVPDVSGFWLKDFDDSIKQKIIQLYNRKLTKELTFLIEMDIQRKMREYKEQYDKQINDSIKKYSQKKSYEAIRREIFQSEFAKQADRMVNNKPSTDIMIISGQLNLREVVPYLKEYANDTLLAPREYAIYALATMRVENYEERAVGYFDIDTDKTDAKLAAIINSQKIWYAYMRRLKSKKYAGDCPVAYETIRDLGKVLKNFPKTDRPWYEGERELENGMKILIPSKTKPVFLVPDDCGMSTQTERTPVDPEHIKVVVDWMEANKGKYELQDKIERTY
jgi:hypothetical protein